MPTLPQLPRAARPSRMDRLRSMSGRGRAAWIGALAGSALLSVSMTSTFSAFSATIVNNSNSLGTSTLLMTETSGATTCASSSGTTNSYNCSTINKYGGGTVSPGGSKTTTATIKNTGTITPSTFTLAAGTCTQTGTVPFGTGATDLCAQMSVKIYSGDTTGTLIYSGTLTAAASTTFPTLTPLTAGSSQLFTFVVTLADVGNTYQNLTANQTLTWTFNQ